MALKHLILGILNHSHATGYEISKQFDDVLGYFWKASHQQIYRELGKLSEEKLVLFDGIEQQDKPNKKVYRISPSGQQVFLQWLIADCMARTNNDEVLAKLYYLHDDKSARVHLLEQTKIKHEQKYKQYKNIELAYFEKTSLENGKSSNELDKVVHMILKKGIKVEQAGIAWCDECLAEDQ